MEGSASKEKSDEDEHEHDDDRNAAAQQFMDNTAQIDVFEASTKQEDKQEDTCTPQGVLFRNEVVPLAQQAILEAGDLLFMPPK